MCLFRAITAYDEEEDAMMRQKYRKHGEYLRRKEYDSETFEPADFSCP
ncbi:MAG: hypothetical protein FWG90_09910 [Oscillospiraceae bacterium]|nr:hypothetical protein [Oscillospiraceae bacterium]